MTNGLDIIIVNHNTREDLRACLTSVVASPPRRMRFIYVVDNASTDGSLEMVRTTWPQVRTIALPKNVGFAAANNIAIRQADSSLLLLLNSDTVVPPKSIDMLINRLIDARAMAAGPLLVDAAGRPEISFGSALSPLGELRQRRRLKKAASTNPQDVEDTRRLVGEEQWVDWVSGACLLVRRSDALAVGLLDERYFMYEEDVDFCAALRARGGKILFTPECTVTHLRGRSIARLPEEARQMYDRSHLAYYQKHAPLWAPLLRLSLALRGRSPK